jgi:hypothetical protein
MDLIRLDPSPKPDEEPDEHRQTSYALENVPDEQMPEGAIAKAKFHRFGRGELKRSDFEIELNWIDVKGLVKAFIEMDHPEAAYLAEALRLARHISDSGWYNDSLPDEEFWEILP